MKLTDLQTASTEINIAGLPDYTGIEEVLRYEGKIDLFDASRWK